MNVAAFVEALQRDLEAVAGMGDDAVADAARRISATLEPSLRLRLRDGPGGADEPAPERPRRGSPHRRRPRARLRRGPRCSDAVPRRLAERARDPPASRDIEGDHRVGGAGRGRVREHVAAATDLEERKSTTARPRWPAYDRLRPQLKGASDARIATPVWTCSRGAAAA